MDEGSSILDRVISTRHESQIRDFQPSDSIAQLLKQLTSKEEDILRRRHGLSGREKQTLEEIGAVYHLTRERIRQIESGAIKKVKGLKSFDELIGSARETIRSVLEQYGGAMEHDAFLDELFHYSSQSDLNQHAVSFLMEQLLVDVFDAVPSGSILRAGWKGKSVSLETIRDVIGKFHAIIESVNAPMTSDELTSAYRERHSTEAVTQHLSDEALLSYVHLSIQIAQNPFDEYGFISWGTIVPKRMNDKIYLVLKKSKKPLHFTKIAELINKAHFDSRKAYAPTIHNELILNDRYVLVGRGMYALKEWGYKEGVVADVLVDILKREGRPMKRDELVESVLKQRMVKKNTIHLALTDKAQFRKNGDNTYSLVTETAEPAGQSPFDEHRNPTDEHRR